MANTFDSVVLQRSLGQVRPDTVFHLTRSVSVNNNPDSKNDLIPSLVWPVTLLLILITFRKAISGLIPHISSFEGPGYKLTFAQVAASVEKNTPQPTIVAAANLPNNLKAQASGPVNNDIQKNRVEIGMLSRTNPKAALIKIYDELTESIDRAAKKLGWTNEQGISATQFLANGRILTPDNARDVMILTSLRSQADLYAEGAFQESDAVSYAMRAYPIIDRLTLFQ